MTAATDTARVELDAKLDLLEQMCLRDADDHDSDVGSVLETPLASPRGSYFGSAPAGGWVEEEYRWALEEAAADAASLLFRETELEEMEDCDAHVYDPGLFTLPPTAATSTSTLTLTPAAASWRQHLASPVEKERFSVQPLPTPPPRTGTPDTLRGVPAATRISPSPTPHQAERCTSPSAPSTRSASTGKFSKFSSSSGSSAGSLTSREGGFVKPGPSRAWVTRPAKGAAERRTEGKASLGSESSLESRPALSPPNSPPAPDPPSDAAGPKTKVKTKPRVKAKKAKEKNEKAPFVKPGPSRAWIQRGAATTTTTANSSAKTTPAPVPAPASVPVPVPVAMPPSAPVVVPPPPERPRTPTSECASVEIDLDQLRALAYAPPAHPAPHRTRSSAELRDGRERDAGDRARPTLALATSLSAPHLRAGVAPAASSQSACAAPAGEAPEHLSDPGRGAHDDGGNGRARGLASTGPGDLGEFASGDLANANGDPADRIWDPADAHGDPADARRDPADAYPEPRSRWSVDSPLGCEPPSPAKGPRDRFISLLARGRPGSQSTAAAAAASPRPSLSSSLTAPSLSSTAPSLASSPPCATSLSPSMSVSSHASSSSSVRTPTEHSVDPYRPYSGPELATGQYEQHPHMPAQLEEDPDDDFYLPHIPPPPELPPSPPPEPTLPLPSPGTPSASFLTPQRAQGGSLLAKLRPRRARKLVISGLGRADALAPPARGEERAHARALEEQQAREASVLRWCESFGEVRKIERKEDGSLHVYWRQWEVAESVCRVQAKVFIRDVGHVDLQWHYIS